MIIGPLKSKHCNAALSLFATRTFQKGEAIGSCYTTLVNHDLSSRKHTPEMFKNRLLEESVTRVSRDALQNQIQ